MDLVACSNRRLGPTNLQILLICYSPNLRRDPHLNSIKVHSSIAITDSITMAVAIIVFGQ